MFVLLADMGQDMKMGLKEWGEDCVGRVLEVVVLANSDSRVLKFFLLLVL